MSPIPNDLTSIRSALILGCLFLAGQTGWAGQTGRASQTPASCRQHDSSIEAKREAKLPATTEVVLASGVKWRHLNPARGDASPAAGTLWGDQTRDGESGFLVRFREGFASPPHIHNITYRGFVIAGELHNDDPNAALMWMPQGSWWVQPAGEVHITAALTESIGYVEIGSGPYLVQPSEEAFDNGERPVNMDATNIVWLDASDTDWIEGTSSTSSKPSPQLTFLWGQPGGHKPVGTMLKLPADFRGQLASNGSSVRVVVVKGAVHLHLDDSKPARLLSAGSYFGSQRPSAYQISSQEEAILYVRTKGEFRLKSND